MPGPHRDLVGLAIKTKDRAANGRVGTKTLSPRSLGEHQDPTGRLRILTLQQPADERTHANEWTHTSDTTHAQRVGHAHS